MLRTVQIHADARTSPAPRAGTGPPENAGHTAPSFVVGATAVAARDISAGGVTFQYFEGGNPDGTPLVLLHGFPDSPLAWQSVVAQLDGATFRFVLPYLRGYGSTEVTQPEYVGGQSAALAHDLLTLTDALGLERFHLVGHDWGARTAYAAAVLAPQRVHTLTGVASPYLAWNGDPLPPAQVHGYWYQFYFQLEVVRKMLSDHRQAFCRELWTTWCPNWRFSEQEFAAAAAAWDNPQFVDTVLDYYRMRWGGAVGRRAYAASQDKLGATPQPTIAVPTLYIQGDADACDLPAGADGQERHFTQGYAREVIAGAGHFPHREQPAAVARALQEHRAVNGGAA